MSLPKYTDEQLSMILSEAAVILSEAAAGRLGQPSSAGTWCVEQVVAGRENCGTNDRARSWDRFRRLPHLPGPRCPFGEAIFVSLANTLAWLRGEGLL